MFPAIASLKAFEQSPPVSGNRPDSKREALARWISFLGWLLVISGAVCVLLGLTDLQNLIIIVALGAIFIPLGLLLVTGGQILTGLATLEKNIRARDPAK